MRSLGLNCILDLSAGYPKGQTKLFSLLDWKSLKKDHIHKGEKADVNLPVDVICDIKQNAKCQKLGNALCIVETAEIKATRGTEHRFGLYLHRHILELLIDDMETLCDREVDKSEWDYTIKIWGPILENFFRGTALRLKW